MAILRKQLVVLSAREAIIWDLGFWKDKKR